MTQHIKLPDTPGNRLQLLAIRSQDVLRDMESEGAEVTEDAFRDRLKEKLAGTVFDRTDYSEAAFREKRRKRALKKVEKDPSYKHLCERDAVLREELDEYLEGLKTLLAKYGVEEALTEPVEGLLRISGPGGPGQEARLLTLLSASGSLMSGLAQPPHSMSDEDARRAEEEYEEGNRQLRANVEEIAGAFGFELKKVSHG